MIYADKIRFAAGGKQLPPAVKGCRRPRGKVCGRCRVDEAEFTTK